jgi:monoamine oxidase
VTGPERATDRRLSRRRLFGTGAAGAAGYALAGSAGAAAAAKARKVDVIVVGAGLAGLAAGRKLKQAGRSFVVLEARERVGGRTLNVDIGHGKVVEIGGQWVGPTQNRVLKLIKQLGLRTFKTFVDGDNLYYRDGTLQRYRGTIPPVDPTVLAELATVLADTDSMAAQVPLEAPWDAASALEWDSQTAETWKLQHALLPETRDLYDLAIASVFAAEPRDLSLLGVLFYTHSAGSFENLINTAGGAQDSRIVGGSQQIAIRLAKRLGRSVVLGAPVFEIDHGNGRVEISTRHGRFIGKRAIIALAPVMASRIRYTPALPARRDQLTQHVPMGTVIKCMAVYDRPFWRDQGLSGMATSNTGPVKLTFDNSPPDGKPGVLLGFAEGQEGRDLLGAPQSRRRAQVLASFERYFGSKARTGVRRYIDKSWAADPWTRGCYVGYYPPGVLVGYRDAVRASVDRLHWAGTETATEWNGYMDGAIQSGYRAAREALERL